MKLSQFVQRTSILDDFTLSHLRKWAQNYRPTDEDSETVAARIVVYLEALDSEDREHLINIGWTAVFDAMEKAALAHCGPMTDDEKEIYGQ